MNCKRYGMLLLGYLLTQHAPAFGGDAKVTLGTTDGTSAFIVRDAASNELARIQSDGKVGIGTNTPLYTLDVFGDVNLTGSIYKNGSVWDPQGAQADWDATSGAAQILNKPSLGTLATQNADAVNITGGSGMFSSLKLTSTNSALTLSQLTTTQRDAMTASSGMMIYNTTTQKYQTCTRVEGSETIVINQWNNNSSFNLVNGIRIAQSIQLPSGGTLSKVGFSVVNDSGSPHLLYLAHLGWGWPF